MRKKNDDTASVVSAADPVEALVNTLVAGTSGPELDEARSLAGRFLQRPWEQLPSSVKHAIRTDIARLHREGMDRTAIADLGFGPTITRQAMRDIGLGE